MMRASDGASVILIASSTPRTNVSRSAGLDSALALNRAGSFGLAERSLTVPRDCGRRKHGPIEIPCPGSWLAVCETDKSRQNVKLHIRQAGAGRIDEAAAFNHVGRQKTGLGQHVLQHVLRAGQALVLPKQREDADLGLNRCLEMILVVLSNARQIRHHVDAVALQVRGIANARQLQDLRSSNGAGGKNHFTASAIGLRRSSRAMPVARLPSNRTLCTRLPVSIVRLARPSASRKKALSGRSAAAFVRRGLVESDAFLAVRR